MPVATNNTQVMITIGGQDQNDVFYNDVYSSVDGATFKRSSNAAFSPRTQFATVIALPVADESGNPANNGLPALFVLGGSTANNAVNDVYYSSARISSQPYTARQQRDHS